MRYVYIDKLLRKKKGKGDFRMAQYGIRDITDKKKGKGDFRMAQYGIRDITDLVLKARTRVKIGNQTFQPGQPVVYFTTAQTATLEGAATQVYAQGGHGYPRLIAWEGERTVTLTLTEALISPESFAVLSGALRSDASVENKQYMPTWFEGEIQPDGSVYLDLDTCGDDHDIIVNDTYPMFGVVLDDSGALSIHLGEQAGLAGVTPNCDVYTVTRDNKLQITFPNAEKYAGRVVRVDCYVEKSAGVTSLDVTAEDFSGNFYAEALTFFREQTTGVDMPVALIFPNVKVQSNFTLTMSATGDPSTFDFVMDCFPAYVKGDYAHKVFFKTMIAGEDAYSLQESETVECPELEIALESVSAGIANFGDSTEFAGRSLEGLVSNPSATVDRAKVNFSGVLKYTPNWTEFSSVPSDLTGYYYPFQLKAENGSKLIMPGAAGGVGKTIVFGETGDGDGTINLVMAVNPNASVMTVKLTNADEDKTTEYSFDFSGCTFN